MSYLPLTKFQASYGASNAEYEISCTDGVWSLLVTLPGSDEPDYAVLVNPAEICEIVTNTDTAQNYFE